MQPFTQSKLCFIKKKTNASRNYQNVIEQMEKYLFQQMHFKGYDIWDGASRFPAALYGIPE